MELGAPVVRVKICGLTNEADARAAVAVGASALGFNTWREGRRYIDLGQAAAWIGALPPFVTKVALLVNATLEEARRTARYPFIDALQLHGDETADYCQALAQAGRPIIKAVRARTEEDLDGLERYPTTHFLIDAHCAGQFGGTGRAADVALALSFRERYPGFSLILAGGLSAENVAEKVRQVRPAGVDVSSGVERTPGQKDREKMRAFVQAAQRSFGG